MSGALQAVFQNQRSFGAPPCSQSYTTAGTYSWVAPTCVTSVSVVAIGSGSSGGGGGGIYGEVGGGGAGGSIGPSGCIYEPGDTYGLGGVNNGKGGDGSITITYINV